MLRKRPVPDEASKAAYLPAAAADDGKRIFEKEI
jgi:hypothetical protein